MIKLKVEGKPEEVREYVNKLKNDKGIMVLHIGEPYKDRGLTQLSRVFVDMELKGDK